MNKVLTMLSVLTVTLVMYVSAADPSSITVETGYNNHYVVNGVAKTDESAFIGVGAIKSLKFADVYLGGTLLPNYGIDQSHWFIGSGKSLSISDDISLRGDVTTTRHQSGVAGIPNSTEFGVKLAVPNLWLTPFVRGSFDVDLDQQGVFVGVQRTQQLPVGFTLTPIVEYGHVNEYTAVSAKLNLSRAIGSFVPYFEAGWYDNEFEQSKYKFATREFNGTFVYSAGIKYKF